MNTHPMTLARARRRELVGGNPARFFALAQRCVWGVSEPGLVRVDVRRVVAQLRDNTALTTTDAQLRKAMRKMPKHGPVGLATDRCGMDPARIRS